MKRKFWKVLIHLFGIVGFLSLPVIFAPREVSFTEMFLIPRGILDIVLYLVMILYFYVNFYLLIPVFYFERKYVLFSLVNILILMLVLFIPLLFMVPGPPEGGMEGPPHGGMNILFDLRNNIFLFFLVFFFSLMLRMSLRWRQAERERTHAELSNLKAQINPHFLFNTLNSIYALALDKSDDTAPSVVKLSGMMRYVISEANRDHVDLEKEVKYIIDYVDLQRIRLGETVTLDFSLQGDPLGKRIAPLLLIPFIENAFKYGVNPEQVSRIVIHILIEEHQLRMRISNHKVSQQMEENLKSGIGIENTKNRLKHVYPGKHRLLIDNQEKEYIVDLTIDLI
jgi:hypothetical protein